MDSIMADRTPDERLSKLEIERNEFCDGEFADENTTPRVE